MENPRLLRRNGRRRSEKTRAGRRGASQGAGLINVSDLPLVNASLNGLAALFLLGGWFAIKSKNQKLHTWMMTCALIASTLFLSSYLYYHFHVRLVTRYQGSSLGRAVYYAILFTHIPLAAVIVPFSLISVKHAIKKQFGKHTRITRWLWPVWMYVSVTGVLIYVMLYGFRGE